MKNAAFALTNVLLAIALAHSTACSSAKPNVKAKRGDDEAAIRAAQIRELNALVAQGPLYFETDTDTLRDDSQILLQRIAAQMHRVPRVRVVIAGNADERGDTSYNLALGERRGYAAKEYLMRLGIPKERVKVVSLGEESPIAMGHDEDAWAQNRRDEFTFLMPGETKSALKIGVQDNAEDEPLLAQTTLAVE